MKVGDADAVRRRLWFVLGSVAVAAGVALHLPMFFGAADTHYVLSGMGIDILMVKGMVLISVGMVAVVFGLSPTRAQRRTRARRPIVVGALDDTRMGPPHLRLVAILAVASAIDSQKPFTFILPGVASEYRPSSPSHPIPGHHSVAL